MVELIDRRTKSRISGLSVVADIVWYHEIQEGLGAGHCVSNKDRKHGMCLFDKISACSVGTVQVRLSRSSALSLCHEGLGLVLLGLSSVCPVQQPQTGVNLRTFSNVSRRRPSSSLSPRTRRQHQHPLARNVPNHDPFTASFALSAIDATLSSTFEASCFADVDIACARPPALQTLSACIPLETSIAFIDIHFL